MEQMKKIDKSAYIGKVDADEPFLREGSVIHVMCGNCEQLGELNREQAEKFAQQAGVKLPEDVSKRFFLVNTCPSCEMTAQLTVQLLDAS